MFVAYYYAILLCAYVFVFQVLTGVLMLYSLAYHLLIFLLFMLVHMSVFLMQCSCQPKFHVRDNKVLTYLLTYLLTYIKSHSGSGSGFVSKFSFLTNFVDSVHRGMYNTSKESCVQGLDFIFLHLRALSNIWGRYDPKTEKN